MTESLKKKLSILEPFKLNKSAPTYSREADLGTKYLIYKELYVFEPLLVNDKKSNDLSTTNSQPMAIV